MAVIRTWWLSACLLLAAGTTPAQPQSLMLPMRDGVRLATDVYRPTGTGRWPTLLMRTPYGKSAKFPVEFLLRVGIAVVVQDSRGRFASEGENLPFLFDGWGPQQDGCDIIAWIAAQPWSDGKIATYGGSALGITQILTAAAAPEHLVCQSISVAYGSAYHHAAYVGGALNKSLVEGWLTGNRFDPKALALFREHDTYDDWWQRLDADSRADQVRVPGRFQGGWYDVFCQGTIDAFCARQERGGPGAKGTQKLVMGPWPHGQNVKVGELTYPDNARRAPTAISDEAWLGHYLKGVASGVAQAPAVHYYTMGAIGEPGAPGNEWHTASAWPVPARPTAWHLGTDGQLTAAPPTAGQGPLTWRYDPSQPVPTRGGCNLTLPAGPMDQRPVEQRPDVLVFTSEPLAQPLEVTGRLTARLFVSTSAPDTDFTVKLSDVYPDGRSMLVADGIRRLRFRNGFVRAEPAQPGQVYEIEVDLWSTSLVFNQGHRLRVAVSSSNYPKYAANPNTGHKGEDGRQPADNRVYCEQARPSRLMLPVVERR